MNIFIDTSSLFKLYHDEKGSEEMLSLFNEYEINTIYLSEITKIEFDSVVWKKFRKGELEENIVLKLIEIFEKDYIKYNFIKDTKEIKSNAKKLLKSYGKQGLRTLDSLQLSSCCAVKAETKLFVTSDKLLQKLFHLEDLNSLLI